MGLVLTARHSHPGSPGEPPKKKPRVTDDFLEKLGPAVYQQLLHYVDGVVGSEIRSLAAGNFDVLKAYDRLRPEVVRQFATPTLAVTLHRHGGTLPALSEAQLATQVAGFLRVLKDRQVAREPPRHENTSRWPLPNGVETQVPVPSYPSHLPSKPSTPTIANWQPPAPRASPTVPYPQSPVPIPSFGRQSNHQQRTTAPTDAALRGIESPVPVPAIPAINKTKTRDQALQPTSSTADKGQSFSNVPNPSPPTLAVEERKISNSPIPLPTFGASSTSRPQIPTTRINGTARTTTTYPVRNDTQAVGNSRTASSVRDYETNVVHHDPTTPLREKSQLNATSPQNFRTRAHALAWRKDAEASASKQERPDWASLSSRPYKPVSWRQDVGSGTQKLLRLQPEDLREPEVVHVDFSAQEIQDLSTSVRRVMGLAKASLVKNPRRELMNLVRDHRDKVLDAVSHLPRHFLRGRTLDDVRTFMEDLSREASQKKKPKAAKEPVILTLERDDYDRQGAMVRSGRLDSLLLAREIAGQRGFGLMRRLENFTNEFRKCREDGLELRAEWAGCAGDITTITWVSDDGFICGTTEHSDPHNQQYNKPGNLVLGSCSRGTLHAYPDHRIVRPVVDKGENSSEAMRESQSPWLYTSVVSSDYDERHDRAYTCGFDRTVKIWKADKSGASMSLLGTWHHDGNVNFVVASKHGSGMVATAADVAAEAVRIYHVDDNDISGSPFRSFSCSRVVDPEGNTVSTDKWAYFPAALQWGHCEEVQHLVAVGYSPRSRTQDDNDIPEDRRDTGELCVWDGRTGERWTIVAGSKLNVFEILWHPTQPCFIAATSPQGKQGVELDARIRTQIRVYTLASDPEFHDGKAFGVHQTLDCHAVDINELTIMPNSLIYCYVTAGCTDGKTYVWDTALGDKPVHVLKHGKPIEEFHGDRESEDTGVKFCAWGNTPDRFYTGSSDGVVKVWNVRTKGKPQGRDLLEVPGPVSFGQFSPDRSKLIIGDATGRVWFLSVDDYEQKPAQVLNLVPLGLAPLNGKKKTRRPRLLIPHAEPDPPEALARKLHEEKGTVRARAYLEKRQIVIRGGPTIGAVQGPNYAETGYYRKELHANDDPSKPLLASQASLQQDARPRTQFVRRGQELRRLRDAPGLAERHLSNLEKNFDLQQLPEDLKEELRIKNEWMPGAGVDSDCDYDFDYDDSIDSHFEEDSE